MRLPQRFRRSVAREPASVTEPEVDGSTAPDRPTDLSPPPEGGAGSVPQPMVEAAVGHEPRIDEAFPVEDVARYYDEWNGRYEAVFGDVFQHLQGVDQDGFLAHMAEVAQLADGDRALDGGCGVCGPARRFAGLADVRIDAVTVSPKQAERARELVAADGLDGRITVTTVDFHHLDAAFAPETFDLVYFLEALVHAHHPARVLRSAFVVLRPGGRLYVKDFYRGRSDDPAEQRVIDECVEATNRICHLTIRDTVDLLRWVTEAGFDVEVSQPLDVPAYSIADGHEFCRRYDLDVAAGRDFTTTFYLDNLEIRARKPR